MRIHRLAATTLVAAAAVLFVGAGAHAALTDNIEAYYSFDADYTDSSANAYNGTAAAGVSLVGDSVVGGSAASFDGGSTAYVAIGSGITNFTNSFTISMWVKTGPTYPTSINDGLLSKSDHDGSWEAHEKSLYLDAGPRAVFVGNSQSFIGAFGGTSLAFPSQWSMITITYDSGTNTGKRYHNGSINDGGANFDYNNGPATDVGTVRLGWTEGNVANNFSGVMDEVGIWSRALSDAEISALYNSGSGLNPIEAVPAPAALPAGLVALGLVATRRRRRT